LHLRDIQVTRALP